MLCKRPTEDVSAGCARAEQESRSRSRTASGVSSKRAGAFGRVLDRFPCLYSIGPVGGFAHALGLAARSLLRACSEENKKINPRHPFPTKQAMPSKFAKVQKQVSKKKGGALALHENSRDALRLRAAVARDDRVARLGAVREKLNDVYRMSCLDKHPDLD